MPADDDKSHERKLAAILAADVAGYSRLMADDELATVKALKEARSVFRDHIAAHSGRLIDTAGDSVLAEFKSVVEAVQCAVEIQEKLGDDNQPVPEHRKMHFRIGINLGDIIEEDDGTIYGDGVNVAARLEGLAAPGGIMIADFARQAVEGKHDVRLEDAGEHEVKNIAKPVRAWRVVVEGAEAVAAATSQSSSNALRRPKVIAALVTIVTIVAGLAVWGVTVRVQVPQMVTASGTVTDDYVLAAPTGPGIMVLPFEALGQSDSERLFANGVSAEISSALSLFDLRVIAQNSASQAADQGLSGVEIAETMHVRYLLSGSVADLSNRLRVQVQLTDAMTDAMIWAQTYEGDLTVAHMFDVQDQITASVTSAIAGDFGEINRLIQREAQRNPPNSAEAYLCVLMLHEYNLTIDLEKSVEARNCLENAVASEPEYAEAWAALSELYVDVAANGWDDYEEYFEKGREAAQLAIKLDPDSQRAHWALALLLKLDGRIDAFFEEAEIVLQLNPYNPTLIGSIGTQIAFAGDWERGIEILEKSFLLDPFYPPWHNYTYIQWLTGNMRHEEALSLAMKTEEAIPDYYWSPVNLAFVLGHMGQAEEAKAAVARIKALHPEFAKNAREEYTYWVKDEAFTEFFLAGLEKAGLFDEPEAPSRPVIAVLPFDNMSGDTEQEYFADGITEDIITRLAQFPNILVLGRNTTFQFKGEAVDIKTIAETLGADYVVEGSIRRGGDTVRVTAQLLAGGGGTHLWAETFDRALDTANIFAIQDEITQAVATRIGDPHGSIGRAEVDIASRHQIAQLSSYDCTLRYYQYLRQLNPERHLVARDCLEEAVAREPKNGAILGMLSDVYSVEITTYINPTEESSLKRVRDLAMEAVNLAPDIASTHTALAWASLFSDDVERAIAEAEEAIRLAPNNSEIVSRIITVLANIGEYERAEALMDHLAVINPNYPPWVNWNRAKFHLVRHEYEKAVTWLERNGMDWHFGTHVWLVGAQCAAGNAEKGHIAFDRVKELNPDWAEEIWKGTRFWHKDRGLFPLFEIIAKGFESCGFEFPPDPGPEAFAPVQ
jgi:adenylate cyclase